MKSRCQLISVVLPIYNQRAYLHEAIDSCLEAAALHPLELIIVDDGSIEDIASVIKGYSSDTIRFIQHPTNLGLAAALNTGFHLSTGAFLTWTSADNLFEPGSLDEHADFLFRHPAVDISYANVRLIDERGEPFRNSTYRKENQSPIDSSILLLPREAATLRSWHDNFINASFMFRRTVWENVGEYRSGIQGIEDFDFWLRAARSHRIEHIDSEEPLYRYRLHSDSLTASLHNLVEMSRARANEEHAFGRTPLSPAPLLMRARSTNFRAVSPDDDAEGIVGFLGPPPAFLQQLILDTPELCFALIVRNSEERQLADKVNLSLGTNPLARKNLRIIECFSAESLTFALSSCDVTLSLDSSFHDSCLISALSGRPLLVLSQEEPNSSSASHTKLLRLKSNGSDNTSEIRSSLKALLSSKSPQKIFKACDEWLRGESLAESTERR